MRIHELIPSSENVIIHNQMTGHTLVLTPQGAVYNNENTSDLRNMSVAFGVLFSSYMWRLATEEEIEKFRATKQIHILELNWTIPPKPEKPVLTVVRGLKTDDTEIGKIE